MDISFSIQKDETQQGAVITVNLSGREKRLENFPAVLVGRESQIDGGIIESGITEKTIDCYNLQIGNFCRLQKNITFLINNNHDYKSVATGALAVRRNLEETYKIKRKGTIIIENDVSIGCGAIILSGVSIQNGAVVLAGAVVTKDVPSYAVAGGNPAEVIGYRFTSEQIEHLLDMQWWYWDIDELEKYRKDIFINTDNILKKHDNGEISNHQIAQCVYAKTQEIILFIPDFDSEYPIYSKVIEEYCRTASKQLSKQFLILIIENANVENHMNRIFELIDLMYKTDGNLVVLTAFENEIESYISLSDEFVIARNLKAVYYSSLAHKYGVKLISGTDIPIF